MMKVSGSKACCPYLKAMIVLLAFCVALTCVSCSHEIGYAGSAAASEEGWTTVVYMAADNDLEGEALNDFNEMISAAAGLGKAGHTVLVLLDRAPGYDASSGDWTDTRLFLIDPDMDDSDNGAPPYVQIDCLPLGLTAGTLTELDMASPQTLSQVLRFAEAYYPAENYALIMWGHGSGWRGYAVDEQSSSLMSLPELHEAVSSLDTRLSVVAFDCCYGAMIETAYELRDDAEVLVATERDEPAAGWNYAYLLQNLVKNEGPASGTPAERYARCVVDAFGRQYADTDGVSITAVSLSETGGVFKAFDRFSEACAACLTSRDSSISFSSEIISRPASFLTGEYPAYRFIDIKGLADAFLESSLPLCGASLKAAASLAAEQLEKALGKATLLSFTGGSGITEGMSETPMLAVYLATVRTGGVVNAEYPQLYVRGSGVGGQCAFVRDSIGWVPQQNLFESTSLLDTLYRKALP